MTAFPVYQLYLLVHLGVLDRQSKYVTAYKLLLCSFILSPASAPTSATLLKFRRCWWGREKTRVLFCQSWPESGSSSSRPCRSTLCTAPRVPASSGPSRSSPPASCPTRRCRRPRPTPPPRRHKEQHREPSRNRSDWLQHPRPATVRLTPLTSSPDSPSVPLRDHGRLTSRPHAVPPRQPHLLCVCVCVRAMFLRVLQLDVSVTQSDSVGVVWHFTPSACLSAERLPVSEFIHSRTESSRQAWPH